MSGTNRLVQANLVGASESALAEGLRNANERAMGGKKKESKKKKK